MGAAYRFKWRQLVSIALILATVVLYPVFTVGAARVQGSLTMGIESLADRVSDLVVREKDGTFTLDEHLASERLDRDELASLAESMEWVNGAIKRGDLVSHADLTVTFKENGKSVFSAHSASDVSTMGTGVSQFEVFWWGFKLYLSTNACALLAAALAGGISVAQIVQWLAEYFAWSLPGAITAVISGLAQGLMGLGVAFFGYYASQSGVVLRFAWPAIPTGWWGQ